ncbi:MAG TPA: class I SAM-dependent methyltransferase [Pyrinomonadaceae bacterium]|nr:class I SAM-dependent methyltransferase [Pyrinomonadaceae bacterium]
MSDMKDYLKSSFPRGARVYRSVADSLRSYWAPGFSKIYRDNLWGDPESVSGRGSTLARTEKIRSALPELLRSIGAQSLLDAACGDFNWMRLVDLGDIRYTGVDVVNELINRNRQLYGGPGRDFIVADVTRDPPAQSDAILCRDCFIHLSFRDIRRTLSNFKESGSQFLLATTHVKVSKNRDVYSGGWRNINLQSAPFNFPQPLELLIEDAELGKCLGLWQLSDIEPRRRRTRRNHLPGWTPPRRAT